MTLRVIKKFLYLTIAAALVASIFLGYKFNEFQRQPINLDSESEEFTIAIGNTIRQVAQNLADAGYIDDPVMFIALARLQGENTLIKAGEYLLKNNHSPKDLIELFTQGDAIQYSFTIIEGWTFKQLLAAINNDPVLVKTISNESDKAIMSQISQTKDHPEGWFLPDTYYFPRGTTDIRFLKRAHQSMLKKLNEEWANRAPDLPLKTPYEALILASIIEKETGAAFERPLIAGAFVQRLRKGMRLQTDPTVIYGMGDLFDGNIRYRDLRKDTPYNTYRNAGLTPTPIALPGIDAIRAALNPAATDALYFVSKGDGTHHFSSTLKEHNEAVSKYQLKGRKPRRKAEPG